MIQSIQLDEVLNFVLLIDHHIVSSSTFHRLTGSSLPGSEAYLVYVSEGMRTLQDQRTVMKYQRKNGSLFNSPSTTAAVSARLPNSGCLNYLHSVLNKNEDAGAFLSYFIHAFMHSYEPDLLSCVLSLDLFFSSYSLSLGNVCSPMYG